MTVPLIVFDWDGTLIDSVPRIVACFRATYAAEGLPWPGDTAVRETIGLPLAESFPALSGAMPADTVTRLRARYREIWLHGGIPPARLFDGVPEMLQTLHAEGTILAVATGKVRAGFERDAGANDLLPLFAHARCAGETAPKPEPAMLLDIAAEAGVSPDRMLMVGDSLLDMAMARAAGVPSVAVCTGSVSRERLEAVSPTVCLDRVNDLLEWLVVRR